MDLMMDRSMVLKDSPQSQSRDGHLRPHVPGELKRGPCSGQVVHKGLNAIIRECRQNWRGWTKGPT